MTSVIDFDPAQLPFDTEGLLPELQAWVECESPTFDAVAAERMLDTAARSLAGLELSIERLPGQMSFGGSLLARMPGAGDGHLLILGHLDTVHPVGTLSALPFRREDGRVYGPGIQDMKAGVLIAIAALRGLRQAGVPPARPVTLLLTADEEVGSPSTRALIESEAATARAVLVPEPAPPRGGVTTGRYAIARFSLRAVGRPSHAGALLSEGRSAIAEMARQVLAIEAMTTADCTFSVGVVHGGRWVNCVTTECVGEALSMAKRQADLEEASARMLALSRASDGLSFEVTRGVTRPVWEPSPGTMALFERARAIAEHLGFELSHGSAGGGADGNFTGAMGVPTLDGLGAEGAGLHTLEEHIRMESLARRGRLFAGLLATIS